MAPDGQKIFIVGPRKVALSSPGPKTPPRPTTPSPASGAVTVSRAGLHRPPRRHPTAVTVGASKKSSVTTGPPPSPCPSRTPQASWWASRRGLVHAAAQTTPESAGFERSAHQASATADPAEPTSMGKTIDQHEMIADYLDEMETDAVGIRALAVHSASPKRSCSACRRCTSPKRAPTSAPPSTPRSRR